MLEIDIEKRIVNGVWEGYIRRVNRQSIRVFTGKRMSGVELNNFFASGSLDNTKLKVYGPDGPIYLTYESIDISSPGSVAAYSPRVFVEERTLERFIDNFDQYVEGSSGVAKAAAQEALDAKDQLTTDVSQAINELNQVKESNRKRYLDPVATVAERDSAYPTPENGDSVWVSGEGKMYRYNGTEWKVTNENDPSAIDMVSQQLAETPNKLKANHSVWTEFEQRGVSPLWFGAVGDGVTDDSAAFQKAIDFLRDNNLSTLFIPPLDFYLGSAVSTEGNLLIKGTNHAVFTNQFTPKGRIRGADNVESLFILTGVAPRNNSFGFQVENVHFEGGRNRGQLSAIKNIASGAPARPFVVKGCKFTGFEQAVWSVSQDTGISNVLFQHNVFTANNYAVRANGQNAIMNFDFRNNVSEQGGKILGENQGFGGSINISDNLLEGQSDAINIHGGKMVGQITRNYFEANTGESIKLESTNGNTKVRVYDNFYSGGMDLSRVIYLGGGSYEVRNDAKPNLLSVAPNQLQTNSTIVIDSVSVMRVFNMDVHDVRLNTLPNGPDVIGQQDLALSVDTNIPTPFGSKNSVIRGISNSSVDIPLEAGDTIVWTSLWRNESSVDETISHIIFDNGSVSLSSKNLGIAYRNSWSVVVGTFTYDGAVALPSFRIRQRTVNDTLDVTLAGLHVSVLRKNANGIKEFKPYVSYK